MEPKCHVVANFLANN